MGPQRRHLLLGLHAVPGAEQLADLYLLDIRVALECYAARLGVRNMVQQHVLQMQEILDAYSKSDSLVEWAE